jgi:hypothetical protein
MGVKWAKPAPALLELFDRVLPEGAGVEKRKMFGYPCGFVNGNMFMGLHGETSLILRLSEPDRATFLQLEQATAFEPMPGRVMKEYVVAPPWMLDDPARLEPWIGKSLTYSSALQPKAKKKRG